MNKKAQEGCWWGGYFPFALTPSLALCPITGLAARRGGGGVNWFGGFSAAIAIVRAWNLRLALYGYEGCVYMKTAHANPHPSSSSPSQRRAPSKSHHEMTEAAKTPCDGLWTVSRSSLDSLLLMLVCVYAERLHSAARRMGKLALPHGFSAGP